MKLLKTLCGDVFREGVAYIFLVEKDMHVFERRVVGSHAVVLQAGHGVHALFGHVFLSEYLCDFLCAVVAVVEEYDAVVGFDGSVDSGIVDRLYEFVGHVVVVAFLHGGHHVGSLFSLAVY